MTSVVAWGVGLSLPAFAQAAGAPQPPAEPPPGPPAEEAPSQPPAEARTQPPAEAPAQPPVASPPPPAAAPPPPVAPAAPPPVTPPPPAPPSKRVDPARQVPPSEPVTTTAPPQTGPLTPVVPGAEEMPYPLPQQPRASIQFGEPSHRPLRPTPYVDVHAYVQNLFLLRNDSDFDRSEPIYNVNGQSVGAFATVFKPMVMFHASPALRLYYEAELGLNFWSKQNPDQENAISPDVFVLKHRQAYAEGELLDGDVGFRAGYQFFADPTGLFLGHWMGAASSWYAWGKGDRIGLFVGQIPDQTYEGINVEDNNFNHDITVFGPRIDLDFGDDLYVAGAVYGLYDSHLVERTRYLAAPALHIGFRVGKFSGFADGVLQAGRAENAALGGDDQTILAWAAQLHGTWRSHPLAFDFNALVLSSDDAKDANKNNGTFLYSSRSSSATIILTEDEMRNWYDQLDRRMAAYRGGFWEHRAGLGIADLKATWYATRVFRPALVVGAASVLQDDNALGNRFVGVETDLNLEFKASDNLVANLVGGALIPGQAASALVNRIDRTSTDPIYMIEASLLARY